MEWLFFSPSIVYLILQWCFTWLVVSNPPYKNHPSNDGHNGLHGTFSLVQPKQKYASTPLMSLNISKNIESFLSKELSSKHKTLCHVIIIT
jgi:hypothetical protein